MARELASSGYASCSDPGQSAMLRAAAAERQTGLAACLQALQGADSVPASWRQATRCYTPGCQYLVHPDVQFGSFCCCKCYYRFECRAICKKRKHGEHCTCAEAPAAAQRGHYVPPVWFRQCQQQRAAADNEATAAYRATRHAALRPMTVQTQTTLAPATPEAAAAEAAPIAPAPAAAAAAAAAARMTGNQLADFLMDGVTIPPAAVVAQENYDRDSKKDLTILDQAVEEVERDMVAFSPEGTAYFYHQTVAPPAGVARKPR